MKEVKKCTLCQEEKSVSSFNSKQKKKYGRVLNSRCRECCAKADRMRKYNLTLDELNELLKIDQCQICDKVLVGIKKHIDHCHVSGKVRGILCQNCNMALGQFKDDTTILLNAIKYLNNE